MSTNHQTVLFSEFDASPEDVKPCQTVQQIREANSLLQRSPQTVQAEQDVGASCADEVFEDQHRVFTISSGAKPIGRDGETKERITEILKKLMGSGNFRPVRVPDETIEQQLKTLAQDFPNFSHVVESIVAVHAKLLRRGVRHRMPHILLNGGPGVGKSRFASALAQVLDSPLLKIDLAVETNGSALAGSSTFWANSSVGGLFSMLAFGTGGKDSVANPVVFVDEVDKAGRDLTHDPLAPLYALLEPVSAAQFVDQGLPGVTMDTSLVRWLLTSNSTSSIPGPILSRLTVFNILAPTKDQARRIAQKVATDYVFDYALNVDPRLSTSMLDDCSELTPRQIRKRIELALGIAVVADAAVLTDAAWAASAVADGSELRAGRRIGFY